MARNQVVVKTYIQPDEKIPDEDRIVQEIMEDIPGLDPASHAVVPLTLSEDDVRDLLRAANSRLPPYKTLAPGIPFATVPEVDKLNMKKITFDDLKSRVQTGDIIMFSTDKWDCKLIRRLTMSPYSHVGIVYHDGTAPYLFHSNDVATLDVRRNKTTAGTQLNDLDCLREAAKYSTLVWRQMDVFAHTPEGNKFRRAWAQEQLDYAINAWSGNPFPNPFELGVYYFMGWAGFLKPGKPNVRFCSDLVCSALMQQGYACSKTLPWSMSPGSLSERPSQVVHKLSSELFLTRYCEEYLITGL